MQTGVVKWYDHKKGYGFISGDEGNDIFIHYTCIKDIGDNRNLAEGDNVKYDTVEGKKGLQAINVSKI